MNTKKIIYWLATGLLCLIFLFSATMYLTQYEMVKGFYTHLGFPTWLIYPLAIFKVLGVIAILTKKSTFLKELAYAGLLTDASMAFSAHVITDGGGYMMALVALIAVIISWIYDRKYIGVNIG